MRSPGSRPGYYLSNFFEEQPALNFGYARMDADEPWRQPVETPGPRANRDALREIMSFWLDHGVAGFRVDMAYSLVKDDPGFEQTVRLWRELREWLSERSPDAVLIPENDPRTTPATALQAGFDADFFLVIERPHSLLFNNGGAGTLATLPDHRHCFFAADDPQGAAALRDFADVWAAYRGTDSPHRLIVIPSSDHDFSRLAAGDRTREQLGAAFAFLLTWGSVPSIYYGDEIGMRYLPGLPDHEGSIWSPGFNRAGCRTPMQWDSLPNAGFSTAPAEKLYLPLDPDVSRPTVAAQENDMTSTLQRVRRLIRLRRETPELGTTGSTEILAVGYPLVYLRGGSHLVVINPSGSSAVADVPEILGYEVTELETSGASVDRGSVRTAPFGYGVFGISRVEPSGD